MSNQVYVEHLKVRRVNGERVDSALLVHDNYETHFFEYYEIPENDLELLAFAYTVVDSESSDVFSYLHEAKKGVYVNDTYYDYDEIKHILEAQ